MNNTKQPSANKPRTDNIPEKLTAHAVRRLRTCFHCKGLGDGKQMIHGSSGHDAGNIFHTVCYLGRYGFDAALNHLNVSELGKFRMCDLTQRQMLKAHRRIQKLSSADQKAKS